MDANSNRVYVNPNFNRTPNGLVFTSVPPYSNNYMHVNPSFTRNLPNMQQTSNSHRKIYVNPNFIKPSDISDTKHHMESKLLNYDNQCLADVNYMDNKCYNPTSSISVNSKPLQNNPVRPQSKSKYRLVRNNDIRVLDKEYPMKESATVKISKYKSIPMNNFKRNLQIVKNDVAPKHKQTNSHVHLPAQKYINRSSFKIVKQALASTNSPFKVAPRINYLKLKRNDISLQTKLKVSIATRKKNNIPCRLFTKYGTCLRNMSGICEYLHDKKHVSLCRKFIKGICHDKACLLSHELSSKKMPTCYFYLKGMCTKTDCPYLHVKLSEKSKICQEFLKGYCDKGDMCPQRHVTLLENKHNKKNSDVTLNQYKFNRTVKVTISKVNKTSLSKRQQTQTLKKRSEIKNTPSCKNDQGDTSDNCRYFKEDLQRRDVTCEVLKPTRCKLGTLPSFIQL